MDLSGYLVTGANNSEKQVSLDAWNGLLGDLSEALVSVATRSALAALDTTVPTLLTEAGREGVFVWSSADLEDEVTADTEQGIFVAPSSDATGASGAWVRKFSGPANVMWFGAVGDGTTDDYTAIQAALDFYALTGGSVYVPTPPARYRCSARLVIKAATHFHGAGYIQDSTAASHPAADLGSTLYFDTNVAGLLVKYINDDDAPGGAAIYPGGTKTIVERIRFLSANLGASAQTDKFGVEFRAKAVLRDCEVRGFGDDGVVFRGSITGSDGVVYGNINGSRIDNVRSLENQGDGFVLSGNDANVITLIGTTSQNNTGWGIRDDSLIGICVWGHTFEGDDLGSATMSRVGSPSCYIACEVEGLAQSSLQPSVTVIGGNFGQASGHPVGANAFVMTGGIASRRGYRHINYSSTPVIGSQVGYKDSTAAAFAWGQSAASNYAEWAWKYSPRSTQYWGFQYANSANTCSMQIPDGVNTTGRSYAAEFPRGIVLGNQAGTQAKLWISGTAAPVAGTWVVGDMVWNTAPAAGGFAGWVCVTGGSPGTWKTFGVISA